MGLDEMMQKVEGDLFTVNEYDTLVVSAMNGGMVDFPDLDAPVDEDVPPALMQWVHFCEYIRSANAILHLVLAGVLVPTQVDDVDSDYPGYRYVKSDMADALIENLGVGSL